MFLNHHKFHFNNLYTYPPSQLNIFHNFPKHLYYYLHKMNSKKPYLEDKFHKSHQSLVFNFNTSNYQHKNQNR